MSKKERLQRDKGEIDVGGPQCVIIITCLIFLVMMLVMKEGRRGKILIR